MMATPRQGEPALSESLPIAGKKRQRSELQQQQQSQQQKRSSGASLPTTGYDVLLVGERSYTQVLAKALLQVSEHNTSSSSSSRVALDETNHLNDGSVRSSSSVDVDRLAIDALQRTLSKEASISAIWKRRNVHMVESLSTIMTTTVMPSTPAATTAATTSHASGVSSVTCQDVDVDRMNHIVIVVPTAFSPNVWETVPVSGKVQRELDALTSISSLRESLLLRQRVSLVAVVGGANGDSMTTSSSTTTNNTKTASTRHNDNISGAPVAVDAPTDSRKRKGTTNHRAHSYVPMFLCHRGQDASFHCTARQLWKRIAIGTRTDPVSTVSPLLLARKYRE